MNLNKIIELPLELWVIIGEIGGPEIWRILTLAIPNMGRYSLNEKVQIRMKNMFLKKSIEIKCGDIARILGISYEIISYKLPNGELHNPLNNDIAYMKYIKRELEGENYKLIVKKWYKNGKRHREDGPAKIKYYYKNGNKSKEQWYKNDKRHREDGPALIQYCDNGNKMKEEWWLDNCRDKKNKTIWYDGYGNASFSDPYSASQFHTNNVEWGFSTSQGVAYMNVLEHGFMESPLGRQHYLNNLQQLNESIDASEALGETANDYIKEEYSKDEFKRK